MTRAQQRTQHPSIEHIQKRLRERAQREAQRNSGQRFQEANRLKRLPLYLFSILDELKAQAVAEGKDVIDLGMGNPDLPPPPHLVAELVKQVKKPENHRYSRKDGDIERGLNRAIATWYSRKFKVTLDPATEVGPLIHPRHFDKVCGYFSMATEDGARIAAGGKPAPVDGNGNFVEPTLFVGATNDMRIAQQEIFGPVLTAIPFKEEADAVAIANDIEYGLAAYIWTSDIGRGHRLAANIDAGMIWVNSENNRHLPSPFGGMKASGIGRDGGDYSFEFFMETKNVCIAMGTHNVPKLGTS